MLDLLTDTRWLLLWSGWIFQLLVAHCPFLHRDHLCTCPKMSGLIKNYRKSGTKGPVHREMARYGLRYEDVIVAEHPDVQKALKYIPKEE